MEAQVSVLSSLRTQQRFRLLISAPEEHKILAVHTPLSHADQTVPAAQAHCRGGRPWRASDAPARPSWSEAERAWVQSLQDDLKTLRDEVAVLKAQMAMVMAPSSLGSM